MKIQSIWLGSWFPKTSIHFAEFVNFLENKSVIKGLDNNRAKTLWKNLSPSNVQVADKGAIKYVKGEAAGYEFRYFEDGLLIVNGRAKGYQEGRNKIEKFYCQQLTPVLSYLYSLGAKGLEIIRAPGSLKKVYLLSYDVAKADLKNLFGREKYQELKIKKYIFYSNESLTVIKTSPEEESALGEVIDHVIFSNEVQHHADQLLQSHRCIWEETEKIISQAKIRASDLPVLSKRLAAHANAVDNIQNRLEQMQVNVDFRRSIWEKNDKQYKSLIDFNNLKYLLNYLKNIFVMTAAHLNNNIDYLNSVYSEVQQSLLNRLQFLFLVSMVVAFISLGTFYKHRIVLYDALGQETMRGTLNVFEPRTLLFFGLITIILTIITYSVWVLMFKRRIKK